MTSSRKRYSTVRVHTVVFRIALIVHTYTRVSSFPQKIYSVWHSVRTLRSHARIYWHRINIALYAYCTCERCLNARVCFRVRSECDPICRTTARKIKAFPSNSRVLRIGIVRVRDTRLSYIAEKAETVGLVTATVRPSACSTR